MCADSCESERDHGEKAGVTYHVCIELLVHLRTLGVGWVMAVS